MTSALPKSIEELVVACNVTKMFGPVAALKDASLTLRCGEVHALVGVNGAGKSTLSRILSGHVRRTEGTLLLRGEEVDFASPREAMRRGVSLVMQETSIAPDMSVMENVCLPRFGIQGAIQWAQMRSLTREILEELGQAAQISLTKRAGDLSMAQRQIIEIGRALQQDSDLIIFDEPTASLSPTEVSSLFVVMRMLRSRGKALAFVSHRLEEIFDITDAVTVMRDGRTIEASVPIASLTPNSLVRMMVGRDIENLYERKHPTGQELAKRQPLLTVRNLACAPAVKDVSFTLHAGEILGLAGLVGAGRSETLETLFGLRRRDSGEVILNGAPFNARTPKAAVSMGLGMIGEDRRRQGIIPDFSVTENLLLAHLGHDRDFRRNYQKHRDAIRALLTELDMPAHVLDAPILGLSGGQQQKIIFARWLLLSPMVLLLDEPTRGVDIGTRNVIYQIIRKIADKGVGVICVSSDFEEVLGLADRIVVLSDGSSVAETSSELLDPEILTMLSAPRSSASGLRKVLNDVAQFAGGCAYWFQVERDTVFCFDKAGDEALDIGVQPNRFPLIHDTGIFTALQKLDIASSYCKDEHFSTISFPVCNQNGHGFGYIGSTVDSQSIRCSSDELWMRVEESMRQFCGSQLQIRQCEKESTV
ncbi:MULTISPECIES: sugar ABC transporter ATP-binding protein [unclassified Caballeronia]|jgi:ABC-type sugar transport system ATPase subunit|uniref:sugar ABC transporter ATP-binding protein n=1 Tax=unclassified Caballeronia TaxID=2646786 RepID=UPI003ED16B47